MQIDQIIKIKNIGNGTWGIYRKTDIGFDPLALENATIEINDLLYNLTNAGVGFDIASFDNLAFDYNPTENFRLLIAALQEDILIDDLKFIFIG
ncbi:MAG: hypothetical protein ACK55I_18750, partial [bacterium]